jgi:hypothetical protein
MRELLAAIDTNALRGLRPVASSLGNEEGWKVVRTDTRAILMMRPKNAPKRKVSQTDSTLIGKHLEAIDALAKGLESGPCRR